MSAPDTRALLPGALAELGLALSPGARDRLLAHLGLISKWNKVYNLTAVRNPAEMVTHHLLDSLAAVRPLAGFLASRPIPSPSNGPAGRAIDSAPEAPPRGLHVLDVGSGAGLPGVTLAIALPETLGILAQHGGAGAAGGSRAEGAANVGVTCVDAVAKKAGFIRQVAAELGLSALQAVHGRIEALAIAPADVITCRAFASLSDTVRLTSRHLAPGGVWMALKGMVPTEEMAALPADIEVFHVEPLRVPHLDAQRCLVWMRRRHGA